MNRPHVDWLPSGINDASRLSFQQRFSTVSAPFEHLMEPCVAPAKPPANDTKGNCVMRITAQKMVAGLAAMGATACLSLAAASPANAIPVAPRSVTYNQIKNWHSAKCLDVRGGSQAVGATVQQYRCNGTVAQQWAKAFTDSGYFVLRVAASGQCLEVKDASQAENAPVVQMPCTGAYNQQWIQQTSGVLDWPSLVARHSGKGLVIRSESLADSVPAVQRDLVYDGEGALHSWDWQFQ